MDEAPNTRPSLTSALSAAGALLVVLAVLFNPIFLGEEILHSQGRTVGEWDQHFAEGSWNSQAGLGVPRGHTPPGFTGLFEALCRLTPDPASNFANYYPPTCLFLLGMAAWLCFRQLNCSSLICGIGAIAAPLNGVFFARAVEFSGGQAVAGAVVFVALAMILRPRLDWPGTLIAGLALGVGILEVGFHGIVLAAALMVMALTLPPADGSNRFAPGRLMSIGLILVAALVMGWPALAHPELVAFPDRIGLAESLQPVDLITLTVAGLFGHRADVSDITQHWGALVDSHFHVYAGALVLLVAAWALANTFRKSYPFSSMDRDRAMFFGAYALVTLMGALFAIHLLTLFSVALLVLFALGLKGMDTWHRSEEHEKTRAFGSGGFNSVWRIGSLVALVLATLGYTLYFNRREELAEWFIMKSPSASPEVVTDIAFASPNLVGLSVLFLFLSIVVLTTCSMVKWNRTTRTLGLLAIGLLLTLDLGRSGKPFLRFDTLETHYPASNPLVETLKNCSTPGRLALLNHYRPLDRAVQGATAIEMPLPLDRLLINRFLAPIAPDASNTNERRPRLALEFFRAMVSYRTAADLQQFIHLATKVLSSQQNPAAEQVSNQIKNYPGGQQFIEGAGDEALVVFFGETSTSRLRQLEAHEKIQILSNAYDQDLSRHILPQLNISRARVTDFKPHVVEGENPEANRREAFRRLIRQWELSSTRYFLCHAANQNLNKQIQARYRELILPTYRNALNLTLDPARRRFASLQSYHLSPSPGSDATNATLQLTIATNGPVELVEFFGALPRAKLFADWRQGVDEKSTAELLFSPGFDPHSQVILREGGLPKPEMPSQTSSLPDVKIIEANGARMELEISPTKYAAMLLLNDRYDSNWSVTVDDQPATMLQANNHARAVHLPPSVSNRAVAFVYHVPTLPTAPSLAALVIGLAVAGIGLKRRDTSGKAESDEA